MAHNQKHLTLISPPLCSRNQSSSTYISLAAVCLASFVKKHGHQVTVIDALAEQPYCWRAFADNGTALYQIGMPLDDILKAIPRTTDYIGISVPFNSNAPIAHDLTKKIKEMFRGVPVILGGSYPSSLPQEALQSGADYLIKGEGEMPLLLLLNGQDPAKIKGVISKTNLDTAQENFAEYIGNLDDIPFPDYDLVPINNYILSSISESKGTLSFPVITSRGCPNACTFCINRAVYNRTWRSRSVENVLEEIHLLMEKYRATRIIFLDDNLLADKQHASRLFEGLVQIRKNSESNFSWYAFCGLHLEALDVPLLEKIRDSGCRRLLLPIEHGDPALLKAMNRTTNFGRVKTIIKTCAKFGIMTVADCIVGFPGETKKSFSQNMHFFCALKKLGLEKVNVYKTKPFPATALYDYCKKHGLLPHEDAPHTYYLTHTDPLSNSWVGITTKDFSAEEVHRRYLCASRLLNTPTFSQKIRKRLKPYKRKYSKIISYLNRKNT